MLPALQRQLSTIVLASTLLLGACASTTTVPVTVHGKINANASSARQGFLVRIVLADGMTELNAEQREPLRQALATALNAKGYPVRQDDAQASGVVRVSYVTDKPVREESSGWRPSIGIFSGRNIGHIGFGFGTEIPINHQSVRYVNQLSVAAFDENAGWIWETLVSVPSDAEGIPPYPDLYRVAQDHLGQDVERIVHLPKAKAANR